MIDVKLEPCPLCSSDSVQARKRYTDWEILCLACCCRVYGNTEANAAERWNTRAPHPSHAAVEAMAQALEKAEWAEWHHPYYGMQLFCTECRNSKKRGHSKDCAIGTALAAYRATQNKEKSK